MNIGDFDHDQVARGLSEAAGFYSRKVDELNRRRQELAMKLTAVEREVAVAEGRRESLALALAELTTPDGGSAGNPSVGRPGQETAESEQSEPVGADDSGNEGVSTPLGRLKQGGGLASGQLAEAVMQVMVTSGREMRVRQITEALGRPLERRKLETVRVTAKRLVQQGRLLEIETGLYRVAPVLRGVA